MHEFDAACLLQAEHKAPFVDSDHLILQDRNGAAIWWWETSEDQGEDTLPRSGARGLGIPESLCRKLSEGWHHLRLETGFEALLVNKGLIVASAWRRLPFDGHAWRTFVEEQGEGRIGPHVPPALVSVPFPHSTALQSGGRVLASVRSPATLALASCTLAAVAVSSFWIGESAALERRAAIEIAEAQRIEPMLANYGLFARVRHEASELQDATKVAGRADIPVALASALELAASTGLQVLSFKIDEKDFEIVVRSQNGPTGLRGMAAKLEALPSFTGVSGSESETPETARLVAKVVA